MTSKELKENTKKKEMIFFPKENRKRLLKDIANIMKYPLNDEGILYFHNKIIFLREKL